MICGFQSGEERFEVFGAAPANLPVKQLAILGIYRLPKPEFVVFFSCNAPFHPPPQCKPGFVPVDGEQGLARNASPNGVRSYAKPLGDGRCPES